MIAQCPKCRALENCLGIAVIPGGRILHCAICGWQASQFRLEKVPKNFRMAPAPVPRVRISRLCSRCGEAPAKKKGKYCQPCSELAFADSQHRYQAKLAAQVEELVDAIAEFIILEVEG